MSVLQYSLSTEEVLSSGKTCIVIDETGNPGQSTDSAYLHPLRKSWAAVILSPSEFTTIARELPPTLLKIKELCGGDEFHMTDIYRGHKSFKSADIEQRLGAIAFMAHIFRENRYPIFFQTLDPVGALPFYKNENFQRKLGVLDLRKHDELALWMMLTKIQDNLSNQDNKHSLPAYVVLDQNNKWKDGRSIDISKTLSDPKIFKSKKIFSRDSKGFPAIQLADFAAYCINRQQWLMTIPKEKITDFDYAFLEIVSNAKFNTINISSMNINMNTWQPQEYDFLRGVYDESIGNKPRK
jgi:hypothetical protein